jgi:hypothetical protein
MRSIICDGNGVHSRSRVNNLEAPLEVEQLTFGLRLNMRGDFRSSVVGPHYLGGGVEEKSSLATGGRSIGVKVEEWSLSLPVVIRLVLTVIRIIPVLDLVHLSLGHENTVTTRKC